MALPSYSKAPAGAVAKFEPAVNCSGTTTPPPVAGRIEPDTTLPTTLPAVAVPLVVTLPPMTLPVADIKPDVRILAPSMLPAALAVPTRYAGK